MVCSWTDGHTPLWITPKSGERGTGNREPETWGHPCQGERREPGTGNPPEAGRPGNRNPGDTRGRKVRRQKELRVRNDRHWSFVIGHWPRAGNGERGTGNGEQKTRQRRAGSWPVARRSRLVARGFLDSGDKGRGARKLPKRQTAASGREAGFGIRRGRVGGPQIAQIIRTLARAGLHLAATTVGRVLKENGCPQEGPTPAK